jgi:iron complex transport system substrate-binding protein
MLTLAGATNAASALSGWKPLSDEGLIAAAPEAIVMMDHGPGGAAQDPFALPTFAATPAAAQKRLVVMDGTYLLGFGPRTPEAARELMAALHPDQAAKTQAP